MTGGAEATISPIGIEGFTACKALSTKYNESPQKASRPFDDERDGFVMGEGSAILILEEMEHALRRNANILAEMVGYGMSSDAYHYTLPEPSGDGAYRAMHNALNDAKINSEKIDYINAHGTSTPVGDVGEIEAVRRVFGSEKPPLVSSTKSMTGHSQGATGAQEAIYCLLMLDHDFIAPSINVENIDPALSTSEIATNMVEKAGLDTVMTNSFGFGGTNGSMLLSKYLD